MDAVAVPPCIHVDMSVILCILALHKMDVNPCYVKAT